MQDLGHIVIKGCHDLVHGFDQGDLKACVHQVFRDLAADEAAAHHGNVFRLMGTDIGIQFRNINYVPDAEDVFVADAFDGSGQDGFAPGGEDQGIVGFFVLFTIRQVLHRY